MKKLLRNKKGQGMSEYLIILACLSNHWYYTHMQRHARANPYGDTVCVLMLEEMLEMPEHQAGSVGYD